MRDFKEWIICAFVIGIGVLIVAMIESSKELLIVSLICLFVGMRDIFLYAALKDIENKKPEAPHE